MDSCEAYMKETQRSLPNGTIESFAFALDSLNAIDEIFSSYEKLIENVVKGKAKTHLEVKKYLDTKAMNLFSQIFKNELVDSLVNVIVHSAKAYREDNQTEDLLINDAGSTLNVVDHQEATNMDAAYIEKAVLQDENNEANVSSSSSNISMSLSEAISDESSIGDFTKNILNTEGKNSTFPTCQKS